MIKVAFYIDNGNIKNIDCRNVLNGNPGIGGTEYMIILISYLLSIRDNDIDVVLISSSEGIYPAGLRCQNAKDIYGGYDVARREGCIYYIYKHVPELVSNKCFVNKLHIDTKLIPWCHNFCDYKSLRFYANSKYTARIIAVGKEQMELYRDHKAFLKSDYIYNCVPFVSQGQSLEETFKRKNIVTYIGSLVPEKGFGYLAKAWKTVLKEIPDAELYVIGSGKLYNNNATLGKWGIAEAKFENKFMKYLSSGDKVLPSVHFMGVLGEEKKEILAKTKVGVPNPSGLTETFGITAVEFQLMGACVTTKCCPGYLDTVFDGLLYSTTDKLANSIKDLLRKPSSKTEYARRIIQEKFSIETVLSDWEMLLNHSIHNNEYLHSINITKEYEFARIKEFLRKLKASYPCLYYVLPSLHYVLDFESRFIGIKQCLKNMIR